ncbi:hypothetical protein B0H14DRAFT_3041148 [Mycena olivaceomarginata]|nr:hypothetical protein B0H14DRAFT_3041148 [Mycena olivaceomarginata]
MFFTSFIARYRLVYALCLLQIVSGVVTLALYGADGNGTTPTSAPRCFFLPLRLKWPPKSSSACIAASPYPEFIHPQILVLVSFWIPAPVHPIFHCTRVLPNQTDFPANLKCVPLRDGHHAPLLNLRRRLLYSALRALRRRAMELHGTEMVTVPVGSWMLPHVADLTRDTASEKSRADVLLNSQTV